MTNDTAPGLTEVLELLGDRYGPMGVALAAAELTDRDSLIGELMAEGTVEHPNATITVPSMGIYERPLRTTHRAVLGSNPEPPTPAEMAEGADLLGLEPPPRPSIEIVHPDDDDGDGMGWEVRLIGADGRLVAKAKASMFLTAVGAMVNRAGRAAVESTLRDSWIEE